MSMKFKEKAELFNSFFCRSMFSNQQQQRASKQAEIFDIKSFVIDYFLHERHCKDDPEFRP